MEVSGAVACFAALAWGKPGQASVLVEGASRQILESPWRKRSIYSEIQRTTELGLKACLFVKAPGLLRGAEEGC